MTSFRVDIVGGSYVELHPPSDVRDYFIPGDEVEVDLAGFGSFKAAIEEVAIDEVAGEVWVVARGYYQGVSHDIQFRLPRNYRVRLQQMRRAEQARRENERVRAARMKKGLRLVNDVEV